MCRSRASSCVRCPVPVRPSPLELGVQTSTSQILPGIPFGVKLSARDVKGDPAMGVGVDAFVFKKPTPGAAGTATATLRGAVLAMLADFDGNVAGAEQPVASCSGTTDGGVKSWCEEAAAFELPVMGEYVLVGRTQVKAAAASADMAGSGCGPAQLAPMNAIATDAVRTDREEQVPDAGVILRE